MAEQSSLQTCERAQSPSETALVFVEVAGDIPAFERGLHECRRDEIGVGAGRADHVEAGIASAFGEVATREASTGVGHTVVSASEPADARLPQTHDAPWAHDPGELPDDLRR